MTRRQKLSLALLMPVTLALVGVLGAAFAQPVPECCATASTLPPKFDASRVLSDATTLASVASESVVGSPGNAQVREWIIQQFTAMSLTVETLPFTVTVASQERTGVNVWATSPGESDEVILVSAHYDTSPANAPASLNVGGIAALLEFARLFSAEPHGRTFVFLATDSEVYGPSWGARNFIEHFAARLPMVVMFDLNTPLGDALFISTALKSNGAGNTYAPLWLRTSYPDGSEPAFAPPDFVRADPYSTFVDNSTGTREFLYRALPTYAGDAAIFLQNRIPAVRLENGSIRNSAFVENWLHTIDALDPIPTESVNAPYWRVSETHYLPNWVTPLLQILLFAPLFLFTAIVYRQNRPREEELRPEFTAFIAWFVVGVDGYAVAYSLVAARFLPHYELFPAAPGDLFLLQPTGWAALVIYGTMLVMGWYTFRRKGWGRFADMLNLPYRRATLLLLLSAFAMVTWFVNGFTAVVVFGLPAYLWPWIEPRRTLPGKLLNSALALTGLLPLLAGLILVFGDPAFGPWWWFFPMGAAYGFFPFTTVIGFILFVALFIRFLQHGWRAV